MNALIALIALSGNVAAFNIPAKWAPTWQNDYRQAKMEASEAGKPLAVFIGTGKTGWDTVAKDGKIDEQAARLLNTKYVCVYIDAETNSGHKLAEAFEIKNKGLVISDKTGKSQAFSHTGELTQTELAKTLERYSDVNRVVVSTETVDEVSAVAAPTMQPTYMQPAYGQPGYMQPRGMRYYGTAPSGGCPNCR